MSLLFIVVPIAVLFSTFILFIIESWVKFVLFGFEILVIISCVILLQTGESSRKNSGRLLFNFGSEILALAMTFLLFKNKQPVSTRIYSGKQIPRFSTSFHREALPGLALIVVSSALIILQFLNIQGGIFQLFLAMVAGSFLVGYVILNVIGMRQYFTTIEFCVISFLTSISFTGLSFILLNPGDFGEVSVAATYLAAGVISFLVHPLTNRKYNYMNRPKSLSRPLDALAIGLSAGFYIVFVILVYPDAASILGTDISRHFSYSAVLSRTPDLYSGHLYLLFHSYQGSIFSLSGDNQPVPLFLSSFAILNVFLPLSLYAGTRRILGQIDSRIPGLATIFYTFLSNLSFLYFTTLYITDPEYVREGYFVFIREVAEKSYFGIMNLLQPFNFVGPLTVSIIVILILIAILKNTTLPKFRYIGLVSFLVASCGLIHVPEISFFALALALYSILRVNTITRIRESLIAMSVGLSGSMIIFGAINSLVVNIDILVLTRMLGAFLLPIGVTAIALILSYRSTKLAVLGRYIKLHAHGFIDGSVLVLVILYLIGIALWFFAEDFDTTSLQATGTVPSFLLPMMLGIVGLLAIFSISKIKDTAARGPILFLIFTIFVLFITGKVLSFVNLNIYDLPYWEKRIPGLIFVFASMLAPIIVIDLSDRVSKKQGNTILSATILTSVLASIILLGFSSLATQIEYWYIRAKGDQDLSIWETNAVEALRSIIDKQTSSVVISPSDYSRHAVTFASPTYQYSKPEVIFGSKSPGVPLTIMGGLLYDKVYIYVHERDEAILDRNPESWFNKYLLPTLPVLYDNEEVKIYNATGIKSPQANSETAIVIPATPISDNWQYPYGALSKSLDSYTEVLDRDPSSFGKHKNIILTTDPFPSSTHYLDLNSGNMSADFWWEEGKWEEERVGLRVTGNYSASSKDNMLLSNYISDNDTTISTSFKIDDEVLNRRIPTSVSIVQNWVNQTNYDLAGIVFVNQNAYVYFASIRDSEAILYPQFPYSAPLLTGLKWNGGSVFNMTLSIEGNIENLYVNGTKYLSRNTNDRSSGFIGISTSGANDIIFKGLSVTGVETAARSYGEYLRYLLDGGNLTVYNTNGYGDAYRTIGETNHLLNERTLGSQIYALNDGQNYSIIKAKLGKGKIIYADIYQTIRNKSISEIEKNSLLENITKTLRTVGPSFSTQDSREIPMIFRSMKATGDINMKTNFIEFPDGFTGKLVGLTVDGDPISLPTVGNLTWLRLYDYDSVSIHSDYLEIARRGGAYPELVVGNQTLSIGFDPKAAIEIGGSSGSRYNIDNVTSMTIELGHSLETVMKTPEIQITGNALFVDLHAARLTGVDGENSDYKGRMSFAILESDAYTLTSNVSLVGTFDLPKKYSEYSTLISTDFAIDSKSLPPIVIIILAIPFILTVILFTYGKKFSLLPARRPNLSRPTTMLMKILRFKWRS